MALLIPFPYLGRRRGRTRRTGEARIVQDEDICGDDRPEMNKNEHKQDVHIV